MNSYGSESDTNSNSNDTKSEIEKNEINNYDSVKRDINNIDSCNNNVALSIFDKIRFEQERIQKLIQDNEKYQREKDYPIVSPISLIKKEDDNNLVLSPPQKDITEDQIYNNNNSSNINNNNNIYYYSDDKVEPFKIEKKEKKKIKCKLSCKPCKIKSRTKSLLVLIFGFLFPFIWLFGFYFIKRYDSKARVYGLVSIILFFVIISTTIPVIPVIVIYIKNGGFGCNNCTYSDDYDYDYDYDYLKNKKINNLIYK